MRRPAGLEPTEQISRVERRGDVLRKMMSTVVKDMHASARESKNMILGESLPCCPAKARESFVRRDLDDRARRAALKNATHVVGPYQVGGTVLYSREPQAVERGLRGNVRSRLMGFEKDKTASVKRNHATLYSSALPSITAELLVFHYMQPKGSTPLATEAQTQRSFIEERASLAEPSRTVDGDQDDEMSEPTQTMSAEKRKVDDETEMRAAAPQNVSFLQARMARSNEERMLIEKDAERNLHFALCPPEVQTVLRETRRAVWEKLIRFNAIVILTDDVEVRQPTEAGREICPMQRVDTDTNAHLRRDNDHVFRSSKVQESIGWL